VANSEHPPAPAEKKKQPPFAHRCFFQQTQTPTKTKPTKQRKKQEHKKPSTTSKTKENTPKTPKNIETKLSEVESINRGGKSLREHVSSANQTATTTNFPANQYPYSDYISEKSIGLKVKTYLKTGVVEHGEILARTENRRGTGRAKS
jgi:hypothetical protein